MDTTFPCVLEGRTAPKGDRRRKESGIKSRYDEQDYNRCDWLVANGVNRRFRRVGVEAFFACKTFILTAGKLARLFTHQTGLELPTDTFSQNVHSTRDTDRRRLLGFEDWHRSNTFNFYVGDQKLDFVLQTIRNVYIANIDVGWPAWWTELPDRLSIFPNLRSLVGCELVPPNLHAPIASMNDPEKQLHGTVQEGMRTLLVHYGMSEQVKFRWAILDLDKGYSSPIGLASIFYEVLNLHDRSLRGESDGRVRALTLESWIDPMHVMPLPI